MDVHNHIGLLQATFPEDFESDPVVGAIEEDLQAFMDRTKLILPPEIRAWYRIANGLGVGSSSFFEIKSRIRNRIRQNHAASEVEYIYSFLPEFRESGWLPIGDDGCGSYYIIPLRGDFGQGFPVVFLDHEDEYNPTYIVASDLEHFVKFLIEERVKNAPPPPGELRFLSLDWPFVKEKVVRKDPAILNFTGVRLPWEA